MKKEFALIVAGGKGTRMQSGIPKQFIEINGKPILLHTIEAFLKYSSKLSIVLVLPEEDMERGESICKKINVHHSITLQKGGDTRFQSVKNGLTKIDDDGLVAIHDGVRPLVSVEIIATSFRLAAQKGSAIASVKLKESIRLIDDEQTKAVDRSQFRIIQTPQTFDIALIKKAYQLKEDLCLTDDASVVEKFGHVVSLFEGRYENIKITTPEDLIVAEALLKQNITVD